MSSIIDINGEERKLGNLLPDPSNFMVSISDETQAALDEIRIPRSDWRIKKGPAIATRIKNQKSIGACNAFAICYAIESKRQQMGLPSVILSPGFIYHTISHGVDEGSQLKEGMNFVRKYGVPDSSYAGELDWLKQNWSPEAEAKALRHRVLEWSPLRGFDDMGSSSLRGEPYVFGIYWGKNDAPDSDGWLTDEPAGGIAGGHAMCNREHTLVKRGNKWGIEVPNSWGPNWGMNGHCVIPEARFKDFFAGAWACRSVIIPKDQIPSDLPPLEETHD